MKISSFENFCVHFQNIFSVPAPPPLAPQFLPGGRVFRNYWVQSYYPMTSTIHKQ